MRVSISCQEMRFLSVVVVIAVKADAVAFVLISD